eukprot:gene13827-19745_t
MIMDAQALDRALPIDLIGGSAWRGSTVIKAFYAWHYINASNPYSVILPGTCSANTSNAYSFIPPGTCTANTSNAFLVIPPGTIIPPGTCAANTSNPYSVIPPGTCAANTTNAFTVIPPGNCAANTSNPCVVIPPGTCAANTSNPYSVIPPGTCAANTSKPYSVIPPGTCAANTSNPYSVIPPGTCATNTSNPYSVIPPGTCAANTSSPYSVIPPGTCAVNTSNPYSVIPQSLGHIQTLGQILRPRDLRSARLTSRMWRDSLSQHITASDPLLELTIQAELEPWQETVRAMCKVYPKAMDEQVIYYWSNRVGVTVHSPRQSQEHLSEQMNHLAQSVPGITKLELRHMEGGISSLNRSMGYPHAQFGP